MADRQLKDKAIKFKGSDYVQVKDRIQFLADNYDGKYDIETNFNYYPEEKMRVVRAILRIWHDGHNTVYTGLAQEIEGQGYINKTSALENAECVPLDTEILTRNGRKFYYEIKEGDEVLSYNVKTRENERVPLQKISVFKSQYVITVGNDRFVATFTPSHKRVLDNGNKQELVEFDKIELGKGNNKIVLSASEKMSDKYDKDIKKLAWLFTDGQIKYTDNGLPTTSYIKQSKSENFEEIVSLFGDEYSEKIYDNGWMNNRERVVPATEVRRILGKYGVKTHDDLKKLVCSLSIGDVKAFYESCMKADGYGRGISKTYYGLIEAIQICCARLGIRTGKVKERTQALSTKTIYELPIYKSNGAYTSEIKIISKYNCDVWCPTTRNGTRIARQKGRVFITGNTSAVGRACAMAGIGVIDSIASIDEINKAENRRNKPKFTEEDLQRFIEKKKDEFKNYQEAKEYIEQYFVLGKDLYGKVMDLYASPDDESQELMF